MKCFNKFCAEMFMLWESHHCRTSCSRAPTL